MKVRIVGFQKTIGMPNFSNDRPLVVEADLEEGETMQEAWSKMNKAAVEWHETEYPHLYGKVDTGMDLLEHIHKSSAPGPIPEINLKDIRLKEEIEDRILAAESPDELQSIKAKYVVFPASLINIYNKKIQELSSGRPGNFTEGLE